MNRKAKAPKARDPHPLFEGALDAICKNSPEALERALKGADPNLVADEMGAGLLGTAIWNHANDCARWLLDHGCRPDGAADNPMSTAAWCSNAEGLRLLIGRGAKREIAEASFGAGLLTAACMPASSLPDEEVVSELLGLGCDPLAKGVDGMEPWQQALSYYGAEELKGNAAFKILLRAAAARVSARRLDRLAPQANALPKARGAAL